MTRLFFVWIVFVIGYNLKAQDIINVAESTLKISALSEEVFYFGFAEGDQLIFNFEEVNGKELKEIEIIELPGSSKFMDYKAKKIENKTLNINQTSIYKFRFSNSSIAGRICRYKIQRIPASSSTEKFNTNVYWRTAYDTTYTPVQEKYLVKSDTLITHVLDQESSISSQNAINGNPNQILVECNLPDGTVSWSYYIGVGREGKQAYDAAKDKFISTAATSMLKIPGYGSMAALALFGINYFEKVQGSDNVKYLIYSDWDNLFRVSLGKPTVLCKQGDVINEASQMKTPLNGRLYLYLQNDNIVEPINVLVKITAIHVRQEWATRVVNKINIKSSQVAYLNN
ncbi:MAG TPA: hypothetical protein VL443_27445 [Cyclobacteriaceae bacterium]|jgi:hypothetical protein|nr:hypothetical protein [Cyclobacteriaceae bacterium]